MFSFYKKEVGSVSSERMPLVIKIVHFLYDADLLVEQSIMKWYKSPPDCNTEDLIEDEDVVEMKNKHAEIRKQVKIIHGSNISTKYF